MPSRGPTSRRKYCIAPTVSGRNFSVTPAFSAVPNKGDKFRMGYLTFALPGAHKWAELLHNPSILGGPQQREQNQNSLPHTFAFLRAHKWTELLHHPYILGGPNKANIFRIGDLTLALSGAHKRAKFLQKPCILGGAQQRGEKQNWLPHTLAFCGDISGWNCYATPAFSAVPNKGDKIRIGYLIHSRSQGPTSGRKC